MSILAGILARKAGVSVSDDLVECLKRTISRHPEEEIHVYSDSRVCFVKADIGAYGAPGFCRSPAGTVGMIAGEPLLGRPQKQALTRTGDLDILHRDWDREQFGMLREANGVFCAAHYSPRRATLTLVTDKLGVRPIYYRVDESFFVFSSSLRVLESLQILPSVLDVGGAIEATFFGYTIGRATPYQNTFTMGAAEVFRHGPDGIRTWQYWRWDSIPVSQDSIAKLLDRAYRCFSDAVSRRLRGDRVTVAWLSGGLDSRCAVCELRAHGAQVHTLNFSSRSSQDQVFGAAFAKEIGTLHQEVDIPTADPNVFRAMAEVWEASENRKKLPPERPSLVWAGVGGSVGLGHVYMSPAAVTLLRRGQTIAAVEQFMAEQNKQVLTRLLRPQVRGILSDVLRNNMRKELEQFHCEDPGRNLYLFLLFNDQRSTLQKHFENIDIRRFEYQLPFFDSEFVSTIMSIPLDECLLHRFYNKWLSLFDRAVTSVPWQAYPGHEPCPIPVPADVTDQWNRKYLEKLGHQLKEESLEKSQIMLRSKSFPESLLSRPYLRLARVLYRLGLRDYQYLLGAALTFYRYASVSNGAYVVPALAENSPSHPDRG